MKRSPCSLFSRRNLSIILVIFCGIASTAIGQSPQQDSYIDSLQNVFHDNTLPADSRQESALLLAQSLYSFQPDSALKYANLGLELSKLGSASIVDAELHITKSLSHFGLRQMQIAKNELNSAEQIAANLDDDELKIKVSYEYATLMSSLGEYDQAIQYGLEMLQLAESNQDTLSMARATLTVGASMYTGGRKEESLKYSLSALEYGKIVEANGVIGLTYNNLAVYFSDRGDWESAISYYEKGLDLAMLKDDSISWALPMSNLASALISVKKYKEAEKHIDLAMAITEQHPEHPYRSLALMSRGELEYWTQSFSTCAPFLQSAYETSKKTKDVGLMQHILNQMVNLADSARNYGRAFQWQKELQTIRDSLFSDERLDRMKELEIQYEIQKTESENALLLLEQEKSKARNQRIIWIVLAAGVAMVALVIFLFGTNRIKSRHNRILRRKTDLIKDQNGKLKEKNELLNALNEEKDALMGVVAHDLKAPLSKAEGLLTIMSMDEGTVEANQQYITMMEKVFKDGKNLIEELVLVNDLESQGVPLKLESVDLQAIAADTFDTFEKVAAQKEIQLLVESKFTQATIQSHPGYLKRTLDNLISNSIKFSPNGKNIFVLLKEESNQLRIEVKDEGPGIPKDEIPLLFNKFSKLTNRPTAGESSTGLGLSIVKGLVNRLQGEIVVDSTLGEGSKFTVLIPL